MGSGVTPALWPPANFKGQKEVQNLVRAGIVEEDAGQASRAISTAQLHVSPRFHLPPINVLVSHGPSETGVWEYSSWGGLPT